MATIGYPVPKAPLLVNPYYPWLLRYVDPYTARGQGTDILKLRVYWTLRATCYDCTVAGKNIWARSCRIVLVALEHLVLGFREICYDCTIIGKNIWDRIVPVAMEHLVYSNIRRDQHQ